MLGKLPSWGKILLYGGGGLAGLFVLGKGVKGLSALVRRPYEDLAGGVEAVVDEVKSEVIATQAKTDTGTSNKCLKIAADIYKAFHGSMFTEDEDAAIDAVNKCISSFEVKLVCTIYKEDYGLSLKGDFDEYTTFMDRYANPIQQLVVNHWS